MTLSGVTERLRHDGFWREPTVYLPSSSFVDKFDTLATCTVNTAITRLRLVD